MAIKLKNPEILFQTQALCSAILLAPKLFFIQTDMASPEWLYFILENYHHLLILSWVILTFTFAFLLLTLTTKSRALLISLVLGNVAAVASFYLLYKKRFSLGFNLPFGNDVFESGIANMHLTKYSRYTDVVIYGVPLFISLVVVAGILWWSKRKK